MSLRDREYMKHLWVHETSVSIWNMTCCPTHLHESVPKSREEIRTKFWTSHNLLSYVISNRNEWSGENQNNAVYDDKYTSPSETKIAYKFNQKILACWKQTDHRLFSEEYN
jgi:hypothetical protein